MPIEFRLPELGENIEEAEVAEILVKEGDEIAAEQSVMELETEKAVVELPCPHAGRIAKIHVSGGDSVKVGTVLLTIEEAKDTGDGKAEEPTTSEGKRKEAMPQTPKRKKAEPEDKGKEQPAERKKPRDAARKPSPKTQPKEKPKPKAAPAEDRAEAKPGEDEEETPPPPAGPSTRHMARKLGVDLYQVTGTGSGGRITQEDVEAYVRDRLAASPQATRTLGASGSLPDFSKFGPVERQRESKLYRTAAEQLSTSWQAIPHVTQHDLADVTEMEAARKRFLQTAGKDGPKITFTAIAVKACVTLLQEMPRFNSSLDAAAGELVVKQYYHVGVAVDTEHGLVVPVIRDADRKTILDIAAELTELADNARARKLEPAQMQGANFTITNLGGIGGTAFTPIVNFPEVAILGMSRTRTELRMADGELQERLLLPLSLSYDHRVINGADAARFIVRLSALLSQPFGLLANS